MKAFLILSMILLSLSAAASSKWEFVGENTDNDKFFVDRNSYQKSGNSITYWSRGNYGKRNEAGDLSDKIQYTINCKTRESIMRYLMTYDDADNFGKVTNNSAINDTWKPIAPDTVRWAVMEHVCK